MSLKAWTTLLTLEQVSDRIQFSQHTIRRWTKRHLAEFPQPLRIGPQREWRFRETDIEDWIDGQQRKPSPKRRQGFVRNVA
jgi:predicted DNA-binding transcriptional regulator AlpA